LEASNFSNFGAISLRILLFSLKPPTSNLEPLEAFSYQLSVGSATAPTCIL
jgi:hypothetical protein